MQANKGQRRLLLALSFHACFHGIRKLQKYKMLSNPSYFHPNPMKCLSLWGPCLNTASRDPWECNPRASSPCDVRESTEEGRQC